MCDNQIGRTLFITGVDGFIGKRLVSALHATGSWQIRGLTRRRRDERGVDSEPVFVAGDLRDVRTYQASLRGVDTVIHLAAVTGKASPEDYQKINVVGTRSLLRASKEAGVRHFLYVSTVAARYPDQRYYYYARSKAEAEEHVRQSGLRYAIIRPTIVIGVGSPVWQVFSSVAKLPIIPLPNGGRVQLQPIDVDDLVIGIVTVLTGRRFHGEALDLGGPTRLRVADFMRLSHQAFRGKAPPRFINVPLGPVRGFLALAEPVLGSVLPITAGQLALFANDGSVTPNWLHDQLKGEMCSIEQTIARLVAEEPSLKGRTIVDGAAGTARYECLIARECDVFSRYLVGQQATDYIRTKYKDGLVARDLADDHRFTRFDLRALRLARRRPFMTRAADAYCAVFYRHGALRRKLTLLLGILEHTTPASAQFDRPQEHGFLGICIRLIGAAAGFGLSLLAGMMLLWPFHMWLRNEAKPGIRGKGE